jgi:hypothetical protein
LSPRKQQRPEGPIARQVKRPGPLEQRPPLSSIEIFEDERKTQPICLQKNSSSLARQKKYILTAEQFAEAQNGRFESVTYCSVSVFEMGALLRSIQPPHLARCVQPLWHHSAE